MKDDLTPEMNIGDEIHYRLRMGGWANCLCDHRRKGVDDAIEYLYSTFMPYIIQAERQGDAKAWARGVWYCFYPNGTAWVSGIDEDAESVRIPQAIFVEGRTYLVLTFNPEIISREPEPSEMREKGIAPESRLAELRFSSAIQDISSFALYRFKNLRNVVCDSGGRYTVIEGNLYRCLSVPDDSLELVWFSPFFKEERYVAPENLVEIRELDFKDAESVPVMKLPREFWKRQTAERRFVALNGQYDLFLSEGGLILRETVYNQGNDETFRGSEVMRIQEPSKILHIITPIARDGINISIRGMNLDMVYEEVEEIYVHVIRGWATIYDWWALQENFIKDPSKLPNLRKYECFYDDVDSLAEIGEREENPE